MNAAHLHLILNHIPVLGGLATLTLMGLAAFKENEAITKLALQCMILIGIFSLPTYFSGEPAEEVIEHLPSVTEAFISRHETFALYSLIGTELLALIGVIGLISLRKSPTKIMEYWNSIAVVALVNACLMMTTANYGGEIRHTEIRKPETTAPSIDKTKVSEHEETSH